MDENKTWIIYCRISSKKQEKEWVSLEEQEKACRVYCKNNNIVVIWVFKETFSWKKSNRPILNEAFLNAKENKVWYFIIFDIDRFSREGFWGYSNLKEGLEKDWVKLRDSKYIIWEKKILHENDLVDMKQYEWNYENNSTYVEVMMTTQAEIEWKKILQRTISQEIKYEQAWYHVRQSNFWYKNKKIQTIDWWKRTIQIKHQTEWDFVIEMYNKKAEGILSDKDIVNNINLAWCKTRHWWEMTPKYMNELLINPIYVWVIMSKWTWNKPIKAKYKWLIDIKTWNKANKWKAKIVELDNWKIDILYISKKDNSELEEKEIQEYSTNDNNEYKFRKLVAPPFLRWRNFKWSAPKWKAKYYKSYHFTYNDQEVKKFNLKQKYLWIWKEEFEKTIYEYFKTIKFDKDFLEVFWKILNDIWENKKKEYINIENNKNKKIKELLNEQAKIVESIKEMFKSNFSNRDLLLEETNRDLDKIKEKITNIESSKEDLNQESFEEFKLKTLFIVEHLEEILLNTQKQSELEVIFDLVFIEKPTYDEIKSGTPKIYPVFSYIKQQKNPSCDEFCQNTQWHPHKESNLARRIWSPAF